MARIHRVIVVFGEMWAQVWWRRPAGRKRKAYDRGGTGSSRVVFLNGW